jgi:hypothetical protein
MPGVLAVPATPVLTVQPSDFTPGAARQPVRLCSAAQDGAGAP